MFTKQDVLMMLPELRHFISRGQTLAIVEMISNGEESQFYIDKMIEFATRCKTMPKVYEQNGQGGNAVAYLHYFAGSFDWYIIERDFEDEQHQAFGSANIGYGPELGFISIEELIANGVELDLHFEPTPLREIPGTRTPWSSLLG